MCDFPYKPTQRWWALHSSPLRYAFCSTLVLHLVLVIRKASRKSYLTSLGLDVTFGHCIAVKAVVKVKDEVTNSSEWMKGNGGDAIVTKAMTPVQHW